MEESTRRELIERYRSGPEVLEQALEEIPEADLDHSVEGWTPRQVIHHVADSEMTSAIRLRRLLAEERPKLQGYDEEEFARRLHYSERPLEGSLAAVKGARASTVALLDVLTDEEWTREGTHAESGRYSVTDWLRIYAAHCHDHAEQIRRARTAT
jgi:DinB superfamily